MLHLIHPALVHFSIAFVVGGALAELGGRVAGRPAVVAWAEKLVLIGLASLLPTLVSGYLAANTVDVEGEAMTLLAAHERNGFLLLGLLLAAQFIKAWSGGKVEGAQQGLYGVLMVAAVAAALYSAWLGGQMVYVYGVGVR